MRIDIQYDDTPTALTVTKTKKDSPTYTLGDTVFQKLNRTVPPEVETFNNFGSIDAYEQKYPLNFFTQFSKPLLLEFSQKRILEILSSSKAFDDMNDAVSKINRKKEQNNGSFKTVSSMLSDNKNQLSVYSDEEEAMRGGMESLNAALESLRSCEKAIADAGELMSLTGAYERSQARQDSLNAALTLCGKISDTENRNLSLTKLQDCISERTKAEKAAETAQERISLCERYISLSEQRNALRIDLLKDLEKHIKDSRDAHARTKKLSSVLTLAEKAVEVRRNLNATDTGINSLTRLSELMDTYRDVHKAARDKRSMIDNHICPVCGNKIM